MGGLGCASGTRGQRTAPWQSRLGLWMGAGTWVMQAAGLCLSGLGFRWRGIDGEQEAGLGAAFTHFNDDFGISDGDVGGQQKVHLVEPGESGRLARVGDEPGSR